MAEWFCESGIINEFISTWNTPPPQSHHLLELQLDLLSRLGLSLSTEASEALREIKGSSKSAKLAKQLCTLESQPGSSPQMEAILQAYEARLARAERVESYLSKQKQS
ncbi:MAG: hypothetical protein R3C11_17060 [Planctomycetaceae bacterium]